MRSIVRILAAGVLAIGPLLAGGVAHADGPVLNDGPVPEEWGPPTTVLAQLALTARHNGHLPGRLGNQHVTNFDTVDEDSVLNGSVLDWWCPAGEIAPNYSWGETTCRLKAEVALDYDYDHPEVYKENWAPNLRYVNFRLPIVTKNATTGAIIQHGKMSLHVKADGATSQQWADGDFLDVFFRQDPRVTGGKFMGKPWLNSDSIDFVENQIWLLRYYG